MQPVLQPYALLGLILAIVTTYVSFLAVEAYRHRAAIGSIPVRVHVNGTRGKSDVALLVGAALRHAGVRTWTKVTGKRATIIDNEGRVRPLGHRRPPNVREQMRFMRMAAAAGAEAVVVECMAVTPELQEASTRMVSPTVGAITNVRLDHSDVMGPRLEDIAGSLAATIPPGGAVVTAERRMLPILRRAARERGACLVTAAPSRLPTAVSDASAGHPHPENVAVAHAVCRILGLEEAHLAAVLRSTATRAGIPVVRGRVAGREVTLIDATGVNDVASTLDALERARAELPPGTTLVGLFCGRADRPARAVEMGGAFLPASGMGRVLAAGPTAGLFRRWANRAGVPAGAVTVVRACDPREIWSAILDLAPGDLAVLAFGSRTGPVGRAVLGHLATMGMTGRADAGTRRGGP